MSADHEICGLFVSNNNEFDWGEGGVSVKFSVRLSTITMGLQYLFPA